MPFNSLGQYTPTHKAWDHVGNIIPNVEHSEGIRPAVEWKPAEWLPVRWFDKHYENWYVTMPGKILATDNNGDLVPAQYGLTSATITYTSNDVDAGVIDARTGVALLSADTGTFNVSAVTDFLGTGVTLAVGTPIGVAPYGYLQWAGGDGANPADYRRHNYNMQHQVAVLCDYVLELPVIPARTATEALTFAAPVSNVATATAVANLPVAANTTRTPMAFAGGSAATLFTNQVTTAALVLASGDWHINLTTGVVTVYSTVAVTSITLTYYNYASAASTVSVFACALGNLTAGDLLVPDANSNWIEATTPTTVAAAWLNQRIIMGQVLGKRTYPRDALERVRTAFNPAIGTDAAGLMSAATAGSTTSGQADQMPGSATAGAPDNVHYSGAADTTVLVNLISR